MIVKLSHTAPLVKQLVQSALSLPTTLSSPASPSASWKVTLCRLTSCASALTWPHLIRLCWRQIAQTDLRDQRKVMRAAGYTGGASALTCTIDVVNGSVSLIGILPNCSAASCAVDGVPSGMSHECDGIAFLESCHANCSDVHDPVNVTSSTLSCGSNGFLASDTK